MTSHDFARTHPLVRPAHVPDSAALARLVGALGYEAGASSLDDRVRAFIDAPDDHLLVADVDGVVLGLVTLSLTRRFVEPGWFSRITALVVAPSARRLGLGRALVREAELTAIGAGSTLMQVNCGRRDERDAAHGFYRSLGYGDQYEHHVLYDKRLVG